MVFSASQFVEVSCRSAVLSLSCHHHLRTPYYYCGHSCWHSPYHTQPTVPLQHLLAPDVRQGNGLVTICDPSFTLICRGRTCHSLLSLVLEDIKSIACMIILYSLFPCISIALRGWPWHGYWKLGYCTPGKAPTYCLYPLLHCSHLQMLPTPSLIGEAPLSCSRHVRDNISC